MYNQVKLKDMIQEVAISTERVIQEGRTILLQKVHYKNLKKIVTRELDVLTGIPVSIVQVMHILDMDEPDGIPALN